MPVNKNSTGSEGETRLALVFQQNVRLGGAGGDAGDECHRGSRKGRSGDCRPSCQQAGQCLPTNGLATLKIRVKIQGVGVGGLGALEISLLEGACCSGRSPFGSDTGLTVSLTSERLRCAENDCLDDDFGVGSAFMWMRAEGGNSEGGGVPRGWLDGAQADDFQYPL